MPFAAGPAAAMTSAVDQTYGQRSVFGGVGQATAPVDAELECEDEHEALAYLRLVRNEASKIPHVMVAPRPGPQAFPPGFAAAAAAAAAEARKQAATGPLAKKKRRRRRHWDEQDDGVAVGTGAYGDNASAAKKRRVSHQQAVAVGLSYDDDEAAGGGLNYGEADEGQEGEEGEEEGEVSDDDRSGEGEEDDDKDGDNKYEPDYTAQYRYLYESGVGDARGYYHDGAYVAAQEEDDGAAVPATTNGDAARGAHGDSTAADDARFSAAYRARLLLAHFAELRALLRQDDPSSYSSLEAAVAALPPDHDTDVGPLHTRSGAFRRWLHLLRTTDPLPAQVAAMDKVSVLRLLRVLHRGLAAGGSKSSRSSRAGRFARSLEGASSGGAGLDMGPRTSRWMWALLARLPGRGELDYREVGHIRDVAKQAVMRLAHLSYNMEGVEVQEAENGEAYGEGGEDLLDDLDELDSDDIAMDLEDMASEPDVADEVRETGKKGDAAGDPVGATDAQQEEDVVGEAGEGGGEGDVAGRPVDVTDTADAPQEEDEADDDSEMQQRATLEMVLAVAGEFYGQRDLLAFRSPWPAARPPS